MFYSTKRSNSEELWCFCEIFIYDKNRRIYFTKYLKKSTIFAKKFKLKHTHNNGIKQKL